MLEHDIAAEPLIGYRIFRYDTGKNLLRSVAYPDFWMPGEQKQATCPRTPHGTIHDPHENCTCGIHAAKSRRLLGATYPGLARETLANQERRRQKPIYSGEVTSMSIGGLQLNPTASSMLYFLVDPQPVRRTQYISAQVRLWGHVIEHTNGYRATYGEIVPETLAWWPRRGFKHNNKLLQHIREVYGG